MEQVYYLQILEILAKKFLLPLKPKVPSHDLIVGLTVAFYLAAAFS